MPDARGFFPNKFLSPMDFQDGERKLKIKGYQHEQVQAAFKPIVYFMGVEKGCVLNKKRNGALITLFGYDTDKWAGNELIVYAETIEVAGKQVDTIAFRGAAMEKGKPVSMPKNYNLPGELDDDVPF